MIYCGITVGPIIETLSQANTPAGLWYGSYLFSCITKRLCERLMNELSKIIEIIAPYYAPVEDDLDGIGHYHDRIIFYIKENDIKAIAIQSLADKVRKIINDEKKEVAQEISNALKENYSDIKQEEIELYIKDYLQIHFIVKEWLEESQKEKKENAISYINKQLDSLELMQNIGNGENSNCLFTLFNGSKQKNNYYIYKTKSLLEVVLNKSNIQLATQVIVDRTKCIEAASRFALLNKDGKIKEISEIASVGQYIESKDERESGSLKKYRYYAIVQADGDRVGKLLGSLNDEKQVLIFSKKCFDYTAKAAKIVQDFGGVPIYAGGDDLLFIAPVQINQDKNSTVFDLCKRIDSCFKNEFSEYIHQGNSISVSFGISINHRKFPLYEAFQDARDLLFNHAKEFRNCMAIKLHKSSGQSVGLILENDSNIVKEFCELADKYASNDMNQKESGNIKSKIINSAIYQIEKFSILFNEAIKEEEKLSFLLKNIFDDPEQQKAEVYLQDIKKLIKTIVKEQNKKIEKIGSDEKQRESDIDKATALLRILKFLNEKVSENG